MSGRVRRVTKPCFVDLFAGCGGLSLGLTDSGWQGMLAVEKDAMAFGTLHSNLVEGPQRRRYAWIEGIPKKAFGIQSLLTTYRQQLKRLAGKVDLIAGGPPCQGFSSAGRRNGADPRNQLLLQYVKVVAALRPKFILMENVRGIAAKHRSSEEAYADILLRKLKEAGYLCVARIVKAADCGVPQERPRYIVLGVRAADFSIITIGDTLQKLWEEALDLGRKRLLRERGLTAKHVSCREAISDLETTGKTMEPCLDAPGRLQIKYGRPITTYQKALHGNAAIMDSMRLARHSSATVSRFSWLQKHCEHGVNVGSLDLGEYGNKKHTQVVLHPNRPSRTLTTLPDDLIHYSEPRILTVREYARLQSFPDWFRFTGKYTTGGELRTKECPRYTQIGNAVAPFVGQALGYAIQELAKKIAKREVQVIRKRSARRPKREVRAVRATQNSIRVWRAAEQ